MGQFKNVGPEMRLGGRERVIGAEGLGSEFQSHGAEQLNALNPTESSFEGEEQNFVFMGGPGATAAA